MNFLMGKKLRLVIFGLLIMAGFGFFISQPNSVKYHTNMLTAKDSLSLNKVSVSNLINKDTDNDGLKDWEESLWNTDPNNNDSDGDGLKDGDEINANRNPLVAGPDDLIDNDFVIQKQANGNENTQNSFTETDKFAQNLFGEYMSLRGSQEYINNEDKSLLVASAVEGALDFELDLKYKISDLSVVNSNSADALKKYGNDFALIIEKYSQDLDQDEVVVFEKMLRAESQEDAVYLSESAGVYVEAVNELKNIKTPRDLTYVHLNIMNSYIAISDALENMSQALNDPIRGLNGFSIHTAMKEAQIEFFNEVKNYFTENKIVFSADEVGYMWQMI